MAGGSDRRKRTETHFRKNSLEVRKHTETEKGRDMGGTGQRRKQLVCRECGGQQFRRIWVKNTMV